MPFIFLRFYGFVNELFKKKKFKRKFRKFFMLYLWEIEKVVNLKKLA